MDAIDTRLLGQLQTEFPLTVRPFDDLGRQLDIEGNEVINRIQQLKTEGTVRQISPVLDARKLGYQSTLVALKVPPDRREAAEKVIQYHPGVSHGYEREYAYNLWITLAIPRHRERQAEIARLARDSGADSVFDLPAVKVFKLRTFFGSEAEYGNNPLETRLSQRVELSPREKMVINEMQQDLPLVPEPFNGMAAHLNMAVDEMLEICRSLLRRRVIRRFGAAINHRKAGYQANLMACWSAGDDKVEMLAGKLAAQRQVSHCYERETNRLWRYNLFAMIHSQTRAGCREIVEKVDDETGLTDNLMLFSTREFKKTRVKYLI